MNTPSLPCSQRVRWHRHADAVALADAARQRILAAASRAIADRGGFVLVLAGGNTPRATYAQLVDADTDWSRWQIWYGDERCAPAEDPQRNSTMAGDAWLDRVPIPRSNLHPVAAEQGATLAAAAYADALGAVGAFDLVLLGLGEDGHTASLFPGHDEGLRADAADAVAVFDAPKPPPQRVSMSAARLSRAHEVLFLVEGDGKREALARWCAGAAIPAAMIRPANGVDVLVVSSLLDR